MLKVGSLAAFITCAIGGLDGRVISAVGVENDTCSLSAPPIFYIAGALAPG